MSKKRANGEGSIRKRKDGRWEGRYTAGYDKGGKVITKNVLGKTQAEVKEKLKTAIEESQKLDPTRTGQYTVQTWVTLWYEVFIKPQIRPNTKQFYRNCMENHLFPALGDCPLEKLSTIQIQRAINEMSEHGRNHYYSHIPLKETTLSPRIVQGILGILRKSLDQAVAERLILSNPAANCKAPKTVRKEMKVLPEELIGPYLHEAKQRGVFAPLYLELTSGLRRGELLALLWKDLNVKDRTLSVTKSVCRIDHQLVVSQPKTKNSLRLLTLPESTVQILVEEHEKHPDNPYMFPSPKTGEMLDPASFRAMHDRILEAIGAEHVRFHDMRHPYVKHTTKIFSLRLMDFQAQAYPDARRKTRGACQLHRGGQSRSPVRPLCNRKRFSCLPPQSKMSWILYAISMRLSGYTSTRSISSSASSVVSVSASKIALDASLRLSCRACSSCFFFACANTAA